MSVQGVAVRKKALCEALADNRHWLGAAAVRVRELAAGDEPDAEHREEARGHESDPGDRRRLTIRGRVSLSREGEIDARSAVASIPPRDEVPGCNAIDARNLADARQYVV